MVRKNYYYYCYYYDSWLSLYVWINVCLMGLLCGFLCAGVLGLSFFLTFES